MTALLEALRRKRSKRRGGLFIKKGDPKKVAKATARRKRSPELPGYPGKFKQRGTY